MLLKYLVSDTIQQFLMFMYKRGKSELDLEQTSYKDLEEELNQLKNSYNDLAKVREQLQQKREIIRTNELPSKLYISLFLLG